MGAVLDGLESAAERDPESLQVLLRNYGARLTKSASYEWKRTPWAGTLRALGTALQALAADPFDPRVVPGRLAAIRAMAVFPEDAA